MRLFTAIRPSPAAEETLLAAQAELRRLGRGSFPRREMLHLTLAFLGETADAAAAKAAVAVRTRVAATAIIRFIIGIPPAFWALKPGRLV